MSRLKLNVRASPVFLNHQVEYFQIPFAGLQAVISIEVLNNTSIYQPREYTS